MAEPTEAPSIDAILAELSTAAQHPNESARAWKGRTGGKVVGSFPMHFPAEILHAAGALPVILQESDDPITVGGGSFYPFFCGYTRSVVDQASKGDFAYLDAIMFGDHCVQMLSAADVIRMRMPDLQVGFYQFIPALKDNWSAENAERSLRRCIEGVEEELDVTIDEDLLRAAIVAFNENRQLIRELYDLRRGGQVRITSLEMQHVIKSSMVMDKATHSGLLKQLVAAVKSGRATGGHRARGVPVYLSGHLCQAPKLEVLQMIEDCGAVVVDDDLYHGSRYISLDADETGDPVKALTRWYLGRNTIVPCPTRLDPKVDWDGWLLEKVHAAGAEGLIVLLAKFCEPHYFYYPRIKKTFEANGFPHLLLETEHETMAGGNMRVRIESFVEMIQRRLDARRAGLPLPPLPVSTPSAAAAAAPAPNPRSLMTPGEAR
jgi:benzoyl-CoA reductase subunit C